MINHKIIADNSDKFIISMLLFGLFNFAGGIGRFSLGTNIAYALGSMSGIALAGIVILVIMF